jgi:glycosyltransferase involved in cell wall biosynthesis
MIAILHGYLLEGSGSNLWTRSIIQSLCRNGETIHLVCQENHPELYDFISEAIVYHSNGPKETILKRESVYPGKCTLHKPQLGETLPVYVHDKYEEYSDVQPMINLADEKIEVYLQINIRVLTEIVSEQGITVIHANHAVLMSVVAQQVARAHNIPYAIMPHGSAIEYAVKKDHRFFKYAENAFSEAQRIYVIGKEIKNRVTELFPALPQIDSKMLELNLGVNTDHFNPVAQKNRAKHIDQLYTSLNGLNRGKTNAQSQRMHKRLKAGISKKQILHLIHGAASYSAKLPDAQAEEKLQMIDWNTEKTILYVGRLIANKGLHSVIAAFPEILAREPNSRLIIVGHGPQREPLEALLWALQNGYRELVLNIVNWGRKLEGNGQTALEEIKLYFNHLQKTDQLDSYFKHAKKYIDQNRVIFTGYLTHRELLYLFPACDVAVFPSIVAEAGPLVFFEAMASGCFPIGTYFAGMAASIDSVSHALPHDIIELMKLSPRPNQTVRDIITNVRSALYVDQKYKNILRDVAIEKYDWTNISKKLAADLHQLK